MGGGENLSWATYGSWGRKARTFHVGEPLTLGQVDALPSWRLTARW